MSDTTNATARTRPPDPLLQPLQIRNLRLRNRVMSTSHASTLDDGGLPKERYQRYHEEKAKGGLALTMFGGSSMVSRDSSWGGGQINLAADEIIPYLRQFSGRIHRQGAAIMCQISHLGRRADAFSTNWLPTIAPSRIRETRHRNVPREMDRSDIDRVVREYAEAAWRCKEGGLDGVEAVTGGHLIGQFFSPRTNRRSDAFGGSTANRARFALMVHEAIRRRVGDDFLVGIRFVVDEGIEDGIDFDECVRLARLLEGAGHIDFFNGIYGRMDTDLHSPSTTCPACRSRWRPFCARSVGSGSKRSCRCSTPRASRTSRPPATPSPRGCSTWWG
jgi:2,4-dienoyl-CoA reductase-like NADH-dependent reductase (Old Yellow Enzyme family)